MKPSLSSLCSSMFLGLLSTSMGQTHTLTLQEGVNGYFSTQDTEIRLSAPLTPLGNNPSISVDGSDGGGPVHGLLRFDQLFGPGTNQVALGENILSATLSFYSFDPGGVVAFHRMLVDWSEGGSTWSNLLGGVQADDIEAAAAPTGTLSGPNDDFVMVDLTADIMAWSTGLSNTGWALLTQVNDGWDFDASENPTINRRPLLTVVYGTGTIPVDLSAGTLPPDAVVLEQREHHLAASFDALPVPVIQWFKDGAAITGAVGNTYTISNMTAGTVGDYFARATNPSGSTDSRTAGITLEEDLRPPLLMTDPVNQPRLLSDGTFVFTFDEDMDPAFLSTPGVHIFPVGGDAVLDNLGIAGFSLVDGTNFVVTSSLPPLSQVPYLLTLSAGAVRDEAGNPNAAVNDQPISGIVNGPVFLSGMVTSEGSIALAFSEEIDLGTIVPAQISIYPEAGDPDADNLGVQGAVAGSNLTELILTTLDPPQPGTPYRARVQAGAASDLDGTPNEAGNLPLRAQYVILPAGTTWAYLDDGSDQGTAWQAPGFDDSTWARGPAPLGYGDGDVATVVDFGGISTQKFITTYYRASVDISHPAEFSALVLRLRRDDGAVVYLNGSEVVRDRMPAAPIPILFDSRAIGGAVNGAQESTFYQFFPNPALLLGGTNVLAVEIHQQSMSSSDTSFDLALLGEGVSLTGSAPQVTHPTPAAQSLAEGGSTTFTVAAGGFPSPRIYWEHDDGVGGFVPVAGATNATLVIDPLLPSHSGNYRAVATNYAGVSFSDTASLVVSDDTVAPTLLSARGSDFSVLLTFSRDLGPTAALPGNYALDRVGGGGALTVTNAMLSGRLVTLQHPEKQPQGRYQVTVSNLGDTTENPNVIDPNPTVFAYTSDLEIIAVDADWRALDDGSDQGTAWRNPGFDHSTWIEGPAELGYGDGDEATVLGFGPDDTNKYATTYFRKTFTIDDPTDFTNVTVVLHYDDGAVSYLNGIEVNRVNMTNDLAHPVLFSHYADAANNSDNRYETFSPSPAMLVAGENTLAVEIHQAKATSSDISFSLQLRGQTGEYAPDMILGLPDYSGGDIHLHFDGTGDLYVQETDSLAAPAWTTITAPPGPHTSPLNVGPATGARRYFRVTNSP